MDQLNTHTDDAVSSLLTQLRVHSAVYCLSELRTPWGFRVEGRNVAKFHLVLEGSSWLLIDGREPIELHAGDLVVLPRGQVHSMKDAPASSVEALDRILIDHPPDKRGRMYYGGDGPLTRILCGGFGLADTAPKLVTSLLPDVVHLDAGSSRVASWLGVIFTMLQEEAATSAPGAKAVFAKIADVFLSQALREFLIGLDERGLMTSDTLTDPAIADAIYLIHTRPSDHWTVTSLAFSVGMSRSAFSDRFRELAGQPPKRYIKKVRLTRAAGYLATTKRTLAWIASECGYESDASFSKAFKTEFGVTPGQYRATASRRPHLQAISN